MPSMRSLQRGALGALVVTTALAAAACGGGSSSGAAATTGTTAGTTTTTSAAGAAAGGRNSAAFAKYTACLKQNGVTLPNFGGRRSPGGGQGDAPTGTTPAPPTGTTAAGGQRPRGAFNSAAFRKASAACASLRPPGAGGFRGGFGGGQPSAAFAAYRNCLKLHGVTTVGGFGGGGKGAGGAAATAKEQKALAACAGLRPARGTRPVSTAPITTTS